METCKIKCTGCGNEVLVTKPAGGAAVNVECSHCGRKMTVRLNPRQIKLNMNSAIPQQVTKKASTGKKYPMLDNPIPVPGQKGVYVFKQKLSTGIRYGISCPDCGIKGYIIYNNEGLKKYVCHCGSQFHFQTVKPKAENRSAKTAGQKQPKQIQPERPLQSSKPAPEENPKQQTVRISAANQERAELTWGSFLFPKRYKLTKELCTIGRKDNEIKSDVELKDEYCSRRSVAITTISTDRGYLFKMEILSAANPVLVNGMEHTAGESLYLNYGDTITMGKTTLTFRQAKK